MEKPRYVLCYVPEVVGVHVIRNWAHNEIFTTGKVYTGIFTNILIGLLGHEAAVAIFSSCGIQHPVWGRIGKCLGLDSLILPTCFFKTWQDHARNCSPSWERLALALDRQYNHKQTAAIARGKEGMHIKQKCALLTEQ